ncbi:MAG TPA: right-handed parallel beta-helix repeat-containing protein, partial [Chitinophagaceae bacterium]|nr:right-handed parallel beta-helix repeat-containing protein [Chitinophagaceae bacterium]
MRQSYFIWAILLWFAGNHLIEEIQSNYDPRLYVNVSAVPRGNGTSRTTAFNKPQVPSNCDPTRLYVNKEAAIGGDGSSWATAFKYLQDALAAASCGAEIWVAKGFYFPDEGNGLADNDRDLSFNMKNGVTIYGGFTGIEVDISQRDWYANRTYLSGDLLQDGASYIIESNTGTTTNYEDNSYHVVRSDQINETARLDGFLVAAGNANGGGSENNLGGGMYAISSSMSLINCEFRNNLAVTGGGVFQTQSSLYIEKCIFRANSVGAGGGGMYIYNGSGPSIYNCVFQANYVNENIAAGSGGGVYINQNSNPYFINCTFSGNYARTGGAVTNISNATPIFFNTIIWKNATGLPRAFHADQVVSDPTSSADYYNSILQFIDLPDPSNLDGTDPHFIFDLFSEKAPLYVTNLRLEKCSPAIDKGNNGYIASSTDLGDSARFVNGTVDLGAFEFQGVNERVWYQDLDGDTWGNSAVTILTCTPPAGYVDRGGDCNDIATP